MASASQQAGTERAKQARLRDPGGVGRGVGYRWATRAEGSGLPEPRQHTCVSNFLSCLLGACFPFGLMLIGIIRLLGYSLM